ncbi:MAG: ammonia-forming cytochrome c nitrite reductase subunit c552 [Myxococcota bacterium]
MTPPTRWMLAAVGSIALATAGVAALLANIAERRREAQQPAAPVVALTDEMDDPALWGRNFPLQYERYLRSVDSERTRWGGSEAVPREPTGSDPRSEVAQSKLDEDPRLRLLYAGYAFAVDYREERGHAYMLEDQTYTGRQQVAPQPGACLQCHASVYTAMKRLGEGDLVRGFERMNAMSWAEARAEVAHPVACIDCHDPETLALRITRPAFAEGIRAWKNAVTPVDFDLERDATRQEMRSWVCAQCHVEYAFEGPEKRLFLPWQRGLDPESMLAEYDARGQRDWIHAETGAPMLKAQHPEFELWSQGPHARAGVACADCHMPYRRAGARKFSDHRVASPLLDVNRACQTCHAGSESELLLRAESIQLQTFALRDRAIAAVVDLIGDLRAAVDAGLDDDALAEARTHHRRAQFLLDSVEAENSMGFHAPQAAASILAGAIDEARQGQLALPRPEGSK